MKDEEYELLPHREILRLREEVDRLKANPISSDAANLVTTMNKLNDSMTRLIRIFEVAEKELAQEYKHSKMDEKMGRIVYQNKEIAKGIIAVADLIKKRQPTPATVQSSQVAPAPAVTSPPPVQEAEPPSLEPDPMLDEPVVQMPEEDPMPSSISDEQASIPSAVPQWEGSEGVPPPPEKKKILSWFTK